MTRYVALLRGINVGTAKRIAMADLRAVFSAAGHKEVSTLLNSGNVVFTAADSAAEPAADGLHGAILSGTGVDCELVVLKAERFVELAEANPLRAADREPKNLGVAFAAGPIDLTSATAAAPDPAALAPEELVVTAGAVYQWLPNGVLASPVPPAFWRALGTAVTARNDATVQKIVAAL